MNENDILFELGFSLGRNTNYGDGWQRAHVDDLPPSLREWAQDRLVDMMRNTNEACGVWKVRKYTR